MVKKENFPRRASLISLLLLIVHGKFYVISIPPDILNLVVFSIGLGLSVAGLTIGVLFLLKKVFSFTLFFGTALPAYSIGLYVFIAYRVILRSFTPLSPG